MSGDKFEGQWVDVDPTTRQLFDGTREARFDTVSVAIGEWVEGPDYFTPAGARALAAELVRAAEFIETHPDPWSLPPREPTAMDGLMNVTALRRLQALTKQRFIADALLR